MFHSVVIKSDSMSLTLNEMQLICFGVLMMKRCGLMPEQKQFVLGKLKEAYRAVFYGLIMDLMGEDTVRIWTVWLDY